MSDPRKLDKLLGECSDTLEICENMQGMDIGNEKIVVDYRDDYEVWVWTADNIHVRIYRPFVEALLEGFKEQEEDVS